MSKSNTTARLLRVALAVGILAVLLWFVGLQDLISVFEEVDLWYLFLLLALSVVMIWASCLKWRLFIRASGAEVSLGHLMRLYTIGYFFNTFTPSYVGGDLARSYHLGAHISNQRDAFVATFLERFTGLLAMSFLGVCFVFIGAEVAAGLSTAILLVGAASLLLALVCFSEKVGNFLFAFTDSVLNKFSSLPLVPQMRQGFEKLNVGLRAARGNVPLLFHALLLSLFFHCLTVLNTYLAARAIGWEQPNLAGLFVAVPLVLLVSMLPLTPSGLGVQEGAFLFLLKRVGATETQGLAVGLLLRAKTLLLALVGALLWSQLSKTCKDAEPGRAEND